MRNLEKLGMKEFGKNRKFSQARALHVISGCAVAEENPRNNKGQPRAWHVLAVGNFQFRRKQRLISVEFEVELFSEILSWNSRNSISKFNLQKYIIEASNFLHLCVASQTQNVIIEIDQDAVKKNLSSIAGEHSNAYFLFSYIETISKHVEYSDSFCYRSQPIRVF